MSKRKAHGIAQELQDYIATLPTLPKTGTGWAVLKCSVDLFCIAKMRDDIIADFVPKPATQGGAR